MTASFKSL